MDGMHEGIRTIHITTAPETLRFLAGLLGFLRSRRCDVSVASSPGPLLDEFARAHGLDACGVEMPRRITPIKDVFSLYRLWRRLRQVRPVIVHAHTPKGGLLGMIAAWLAGAPVRIYHIRGLPFMTATGFRRRLLTWSEKIACRLAHRVFAVSHSMREIAIAERLCPPEKILTPLSGSGNGVDAAGRFNPENLASNAREQTRAQYDIPSDAVVVGYVGRIVRDKGIAELVEAWRDLRERFPQLHLLVVGHHEPQDPAPPEAVRVLHTDPRIHLTGTNWNTPPLYAAMDLVVLPTYREGFPNVPLEAAAMRRAVVATNVPGCTDAVQHGVTGTLVAPRDAEALARAVTRYVTDPALRTRHGEAGRTRAVRDFAPERIWREVWKEYCRLLCGIGLTVVEAPEDPTQDTTSNRRIAA